MWLLVASLFAIHALLAVAAPTVGTSFLFAFPCLGNNANLFISVTNPNEVDASLSIYSSDPDFDPMEQSVDALSTLQIQFYDPDMQLCNPTNQVAQRGILVQSTQPVSVYVDMETSDGIEACNFLVLPTSFIGRQYPLNTYAYNLVVALQDDTQLTFSSDSTNVVLNRMEAVVLSKGGNMTANKNVAVIYAMSYYSSSSSYGHDAFMALPVTYKATEFPIVPHPNVSSTLVRVFAFDDHTYVILNGLTQTQINAGSYYDMNIQQPSLIATSKKAQVVTGYYYYSYQVGAQVVPSTYFLTSRSVPFHPMTHIQYNSKDPIHNLLVIGTQAAAGQIAVDGTAIPALQYKRIGTSSYYYTIIPVSGDQHVITTNAANIKYTASVFSTYSGASYAVSKFNIGLELPTTRELELIKNQE